MFFKQRKRIEDYSNGIIHKKSSEESLMYCIIFALIAVLLHFYSIKSFDNHDTKHVKILVPIVAGIVAIQQNQINNLKEQLKLGI